jgi:ADP-heptose:LPS heptosyltransferase
LLQGIRRKHPKAQIDFLLPEAHLPLVVPSQLARQCLVYSGRQLRPWTPAFWSLVRSVRKNSYGVAILMTLDAAPQLERVLLGSGAALRLGPSHRQAYPAINFEIRPPTDRALYRGQRPALAAPFLGLDADQLVHGWPLPADKRRRMRQLVHFNKPRKEEILVGIDPGLGKTGHGIALQNLHFLVKQLSSQICCRILPLSDPGNQERAARFEAHLTGPPTGLPRDNLLDSILLLCECDLLVAGNTDLLHVAVAKGIPTIGLFMPQDGPQWHPTGRDKIRILRITQGQRVDIDTLMEAVEAVAGDLDSLSSERLAGADGGAELR